MSASRRQELMVSGQEAMTVATTLLPIAATTRSAAAASCALGVGRSPLNVTKCFCECGRPFGWLNRQGHKICALPRPQDRPGGPSGGRSPPPPRRAWDSAGPARARAREGLSEPSCLPHQAVIRSRLARRTWHARSGGGSTGAACAQWAPMPRDCGRPAYPFRHPADDRNRDHRHHRYLDLPARHCRKRRPRRGRPLRRGHCESSR
jgi:hypothetical protein